MRIIAGSAKGRRLKVPKGSSPRPTSDLIREAAFAILQSLDLDWSRVLDLYAGTGAMGIEALSRGAGWVDFVDRDAKCCAIIRENLQQAAFIERARVHCRDVKAAISDLTDPYTVVFLDPPYGDPGIPGILNSMARSRAVRPGTVLVAEHSKRVALAEAYNGLKRIKERRHGDSVLSIYRLEV